MNHQWIISQIGARQHYGVPYGFEICGQLNRLYTDAWRPRPLPALRHGPAAVRAWAGRFHPGIPPQKVVAFNRRTLFDQFRNLLGRRDNPDAYTNFLRIGDAFDRAVLADLSRPGAVDPQTDAFFAFNTGALNCLNYLRDHGVVSVLDQIDPAKVEHEIVAEETEKFPGWEPAAVTIPQAYWDRMSAEWAAADLVLVNSNWSRSALLKQGVPAKKMCVVPVAYEPGDRAVALRRSAPEQPLLVLWLGTVCLRKGIQYLIQAAKILEHANIKFLVAGPITISADAVASAPANVTFLGRITRDRTEALYDQADVFVLPTVSDGFAITQVEAMSRGLPVITTPNCGDVVRDGIDGRIVPARDSRSLAEVIAALEADRDRLIQMGAAAVRRAGDFSLEDQTRRVEAALASRHDRRNASSNI